MEITLTKEESELFDLLLGSLAYRKKKSIIRVAGGWVRDKVLKKESPDIDVALDDQTGVEFANGVNEYLAHLGQQTRTVAIIMANPDQSKHLETATLKVLGFDLDCVHLRAECYTDSRIPEIVAGTAFDDAQRRDFTINALFYNINTKCVEDLTGRGIQDLKSGTIRTPISPFITFQEDPLRVLRAVRFASRYGFQLTDELVAAAQSPDIKQALLSKISKERIYKECDGMIQRATAEKTCCPANAIMLLQELDIIDAVLPAQQTYKQHAEAAIAAAIAAANAKPVGGKKKRSATDDSLPLPQPPTAAAAATDDTIGLDNNTYGKSAPPPRGYDDNAMPISDYWYCEGVETACWLNVLLRGRGLLGLWPSKLGIVPPVGMTWASTIPGSALRLPEFQAEHAKLAYWAAVMTPLATANVMVKEKTHMRDVAISTVLLRDGLKVDLATVKGVQTLLDGMVAFNKHIDDCKLLIIQQEEGTMTTTTTTSSSSSSGSCSSSSSFAFESEWIQAVDTFGCILRNCKSLWRDALLLACAQRLALNSANSLQQTVDERWAFQDVDISPVQQQLIMSFIEIEHLIDTGMNMDGIWEMKPLMNGSELVKTFNLPKGPIIGHVMESMLIWQIRRRSRYITSSSTEAAAGICSSGSRCIDTSTTEEDLSEFTAYMHEHLPKLLSGASAADVAKETAAVYTTK